jgi:hypothetical protein
MGASNKAGRFLPKIFLLIGAHMALQGKLRSFLSSLVEKAHKIECTSQIQDFWLGFSASKTF